MEIKKNFEIVKKDEESHLVFGWASVAKTKDGRTLIDYQGDMIEPEELEKAAYNFVLNFRNTGEEHNPNLRKKGRLVESIVFTKEKQKALGIPEGLVHEGWFIGFHIEDPNTWDKVKKGNYMMFSIEGSGERTPVEKQDKKYVYNDLI